MTRPWRLTRRQRVEMEAGLLWIRSGVTSDPGYSPTDLPVPHDDSREMVTDIARAECVATGTLCTSATISRAARTLRARVAIALRAALRADEDARCEDAAYRIGDAFGYDAECAIGEMREWPAMAWVPRVPLALWERRPSLWAQSPPTSDARGPR